MKTIPFFRPEMTQGEIREVVDVLRSGWLTTGPRVRRFENEFAAAVGAPFSVAVNSCTAALHLAMEALGLTAGQLVLVPTMTFAATAEVVRYVGAIPLLVDCDPATTNMSLEDAEEKVARLRSGKLPAPLPRRAPVAGIVPVHVGGLMMDVGAIQRLARRLGLWIVEDAAHAFPAAWRRSAARPWQRCGEGTAAVTCFSFYANKTITTGEGGMAVTADAKVAERMRSMSLHGLSRDAWTRYGAGGSWDYRIVAPGFKYNLTDIAAAIGLHQLARAESMRARREAIARAYRDRLQDIEELSLPGDTGDRIHAWHLFPIRLKLERLSVTREEFVEALKREGIGFSVHWRPLHLHPYYRERFGWRLLDFPMATECWKRLVSLPIFPSMSEGEIERVSATVRQLCLRYSRTRVQRRSAVA